MIAQACLERSKAGILEGPNVARTLKYKVVVKNRRALICLGTIPALEYLKQCVALKAVFF